MNPFSPVLLTGPSPNRIEGGPDGNLAPLMGKGCTGLDAVVNRYKYFDI